jgi:FkbM family methyltransferase
MTKIIYDFGMNNGDDIEYYLKKADKVVGVDANPVLCKICEDKFSDYIDDGKLVILNLALSDSSALEPVDFYIHKDNHVLSQLERPREDTINLFERIQISKKRASEVIRDHGNPHYVKIDLEGVDSFVLTDIFDNNIAPEFISAEVHSVLPFALLVSRGYDSFNLVDGASVHVNYANARIRIHAGEAEHSFKCHSAGPYGEDITSPWWTANSFLCVLAYARLGWKDIHATNVIEPTSNMVPPMRIDFKDHLRDFFPSFARAVKNRFSK